MRSATSARSAKRTRRRSTSNDYAGTTLTGKSGVERAYEKELHGSAGSSSCSSMRRAARVERIGRAAVDARAQGADRRQRSVPDDRSCACSRRPKKRCAVSAPRRSRSIRRNGDVIAFVSTPAFDPNLFARGLTRPQYLALTEDPDRPMYDRALRGVYPPGSTVKPMLALAALEYGVVTPQRHALLPRHVVRCPATDARGATGSPAGMAPSTCARRSRPRATCTSSTSRA